MRTEARTVYSNISRLFILSKCYLNTAYSFDSNKNLIVNKRLHVIQFAVLVLLNVVTAVFKIFVNKSFSFKNPYRAVTQIYAWWSVVYTFLVLCQTRRQNRSLVRIFEEMKTVQCQVRLTEQQERHFSREVKRWITVYAVGGFLCLAYSFHTREPSIPRAIVHRLKNDINDVYSGRILLGIINLFLQIVYIAFINVTIIKYWAYHNDKLLYVEVAFVQIYMVYYVYNLVELVRHCSKLVEKGRVTSRRVCKLFGVPLDNDVRCELAVFSLELLHRKNNITARGLFTVDAKLMSSVASSAVMYTIVILQLNFPGYENGITPIADLYE
ncbi:UNVERIFIED_CONTAM: hypothetical protein PYX00_005897 [Menopon gallinae]|uniref:Gustatory receptor n=2 Tax=Menopon gallinae TaxID=328185 RepID=A0AAW2HTA3_9NEOP